MIRPVSRQCTRSLIEKMSGMSCSMTISVAVELGADAHQEGAEGFGLSLSDAGGWFVEAEDACVEREQARELSDPTGAGRKLTDERVGVATESHDLDEVVGASELPLLVVTVGGKTKQRRGERGTSVGFERDPRPSPER